MTGAGYKVFRSLGVNGGVKLCRAQLESSTPGLFGAGAVTRYVCRVSGIEHAEPVTHCVLDTYKKRRGGGIKRTIVQCPLHSGGV